MSRSNLLYFLFFCLFSFAFILPVGSWNWEELESKSVGEVLVNLGDAAIISHLPDTSLKGVSAQKGRELVLDGYTTHPGGGRTKRVSAYFECTACHNVTAETSLAKETNPAERLSFCASKGIPYLPGSPLYGIVSRTDFYNGDYEKKYGDLVTDARNDLRAAIQLCATECSQGRALEDWEMESVLAYLWTIDRPMASLDMSDMEWEMIQNEISRPGRDTLAIEAIKSKYVTAYPATFVDPPENRKEGNGIEGDPVRGKLFYTQSCLHCHENKRYSLFALDTTAMTIRQLARRMPTYHQESIYQVARYGTSPLRGKGAYMPNYTLEKMDEQQLADLRSYIMAYQ